MNQIIKNDIEQYFKQIRLLLPILGKEERKFLSDFKVTVEEYAEHQTGCCLEDVKERFGEPEDVVHDYVTMLDQFQLCKRINLRNLIKRAIFIMLLLIIILVLYRMIVFQDAYQQAIDGMASYAVSVIE